MKRDVVIGGIIFLIALGMRWYDLPNRVVFTADEEYQVNIAASIVKDFHVIWIGVSAANTGFYMGPYLNYWTAAWLKIANLDPVILSYVSGFFGALTAPLLVYAGGLMKNRKVGMIAGLSYAMLPLVVYYDQKYYPFGLPLIALGLVVGLIKVKQNKWWLVFLAGLAGVVWHIHLALVPWIVAVGVYLVYEMRRKWPVRVLLVSAGVVGVMIAPLVVFDWVHKGSNVGVVGRIGEIGSNENTRINPMRKLAVTGEFLARLWWLNQGSANADELVISCAPKANMAKSISTHTNPPIWLMIAAGVVGGWGWIKMRRAKVERANIWGVMGGAGLMGFVIAPSNAFEYYLLPLIPVYLIWVAWVIDGGGWKKVLWVGLLGYGVVQLLNNNNAYGLEAKKQLVAAVKQETKGETIEVVEKGGCHQFEGWRYVFKAEGYRPSRASTDGVFGWLYPDELGGEAKWRVNIDEKRVAGDNPGGVTRLERGGFEATIERLN